MPRNSTNIVSEIRRFCNVLYDSGDVFECRVLDVPKAGVLSGYFNDPEALARAVIEHDGVANIYVTLNPVLPDLLARANNRLLPARGGATTRDEEIVRRRWLLLDLDPVRPSKISATDREKMAARERARAVFRFLQQRGWPDPVVADSGNGVYLLYRVELLNDEASKALLKDVLLALSLLFDDEEVVVDTSTFNAARLVRLVGTINAKGDPTPDRPHRRSSLLYVPPELHPVPAEKLEELARLVRSAESPRRGFDLGAWVHQHLGDLVVKEKPWQGGRLWGLNPCPMNPEHKNQSAFVAQLPDGKIIAGCHHNSCQWWGWRDLREKFDPAGAVAEAPEEELDLDVQDWPAPPDDDAFYGLAGDFVKFVEPYTEADPVAILGQFLVAFGNAAGRNAHIRVEADRHYANEFLALVGSSAKARKGVSWGHVREVFKLADDAWVANIVHGLVSGEGLAYWVRDPVYKGEEVIDEGVTDKRLLALEAEFARVLKVLQREGNTLSAQLRMAWDTGELRSLAKNSPVKATGAHVSVIVHTTREELLRLLEDVEVANGFANRFVWLCVRRSKMLPFGGRVPEEALEEIARKVKGALGFARGVREVSFTDPARELWEEVYESLSRERVGLLGAVLARAEAHVLRLALIYALLDLSPVVDVPHLKAALAFWDYAERSASYIFGKKLGDRIAGRVVQALEVAGEKGLTRTQLYRLFKPRIPSDRLGEILEDLLASGVVERIEEGRGERGRPAERWVLKVGPKIQKTPKNAPGQTAQGFPAGPKNDQKIHQKIGTSVGTGTSGDEGMGTGGSVDASPSGGERPLLCSACGGETIKVSEGGGEEERRCTRCGWLFRVKGIVLPEGEFSLPSPPAKEARVKNCIRCRRPGAGEDGYCQQCREEVRRALNEIAREWGEFRLEDDFDF
ncbi:hypothetical protein Adeg_0412 [Ammonifex degensii KC4]|uniref:Uncharacterized protein n=1 Tax=Ammonifex degensii (strain DSM 10501 / KC4) TaxID=429009 RepID=C9RBD8_AMMDK|nr:DUF3987 domain-containing protein [Ammonifex degensii]ACX51565.1 hypothetical protein Adeg_0412 [Ammonifex degensii KC4]